MLNRRRCAPGPEELSRPKREEFPASHSDAIWQHSLRTTQAQMEIVLDHHLHKETLK